MSNREDWYLKNRGDATFSGGEKANLFNQEEELFEAKLKQYNNAYDVTVNRYYETTAGKRTLLTRAIVQSLAGYKNINNSRKILARKSFGLRTGDLITFNGDTWITTDWINKQRGTDDYSSLMFCNHSVSFAIDTKVDSGQVDEFGRPIYIVSSTTYDFPCYYTTNVIDSYTDYAINLPDNRAKAYVQSNNLLKIGTEVTVAGTNYLVHGIDKSYIVNNDSSVGFEYGVMILTLETPITTT